MKYITNAETSQYSTKSKDELITGGSRSDHSCKIPKSRSFQPKQRIKRSSQSILLSYCEDEHNESKGASGKSVCTGVPVATAQPLGKAPASTSFRALEENFRALEGLHLLDGSQRPECRRDAVQRRCI